MASPWTRKSTRAKPSAPIARYASRAILRIVGPLRGRSTSARVDVSDRPGRVLRGVVVELVAGHDLARTEQLDAGRVVAEDRDLEVAGAAQVRLGEGERVVAERRLERGVDLGGVVDQRHPDRAAEAGRLDHQPPVAGCPLRTRSSSPRTSSGAAAQRAAVTSSQSTTGRPIPRHSRLKMALSMPIADAVTPDPV